MATSENTLSTNYDILTTPSDFDTEISSSTVSNEPISTIDEESTTDALQTSTEDATKLTELPTVITSKDTFETTGTFKTTEDFTQYTESETTLKVDSTIQDSTSIKSTVSEESTSTQNTDKPSTELNDFTTTKIPVEFSTTPDSLDVTTIPTSVKTDGTSTISSTDITNDYEVTTEQNALCPDGFFGNVPHPVYCNSFYLCTGGIAVQLFCRDGYEYNEIIAVSI